MKEGLQADFPHEQLRKYGCYFFCLAKWAELLLDKEFGNDELISLYVACTRKGFMEEDCFIVNPADALNLMLGEARFRSAAKTGKRPDEPVYAVYLKNDRQGHFVLSVNGVVWDPLPPGRQAVYNYKLDSYRVIT